MAIHTFPESALFTALASGTFINGNFGGTASGAAPAGQYEYHTIVFLGTLANNGTINAYACTNAAGSSPNVVATLNVGSANGAGALVMVKADALNAVQGGTSGTSFTHLCAAGTVEAGGTWRGALAIISTAPRSGGSVGGIAAGALGSALY